MAFWSRKRSVDVAETPEEREHSGGWYSDPYGAAARRWYDNKQGWTDRVEGEGLKPDKTGVARLDEAAAADSGE